MSQRDALPSAAEPRVAAAADGSLSHGISFEEALRTWARVALNSFGGPTGQIAVMHRILVEEKRWVSEERFLHADQRRALWHGDDLDGLLAWLRDYRPAQASKWLDEKRRKDLR